MNVLDENIVASQCALLRNWHIRFRQIGRDVGRHGIDDEQVLSLLKRLSRPTFFTRDAGFYQRHLCHASYCLVCLAVGKEEAAVFIRRFLKHPQFASQRKRLGAVVSVAQTGLRVYRTGENAERTLTWPANSKRR